MRSSQRLRPGHSVNMRLATLSDIERAVHAQLARATSDRHHEWRTPVLATVRAGDVPEADARTVVLREATPACLTLFTDARSPKVAQLARNPRGTLVFWSRRLKWQLRVACDLEIVTAGPRAEVLGGRVLQSPAAGDYLGLAPPGAALERPEDATRGETPHFALVECRIHAMDWLELSPEGHRRARFQGGRASWLVP